MNHRERHVSVIMEPCCEISAPGYVPPPRPYYVRTPGWAPERCGHAEKRVPVTASHLSGHAALQHITPWTRGWHTTAGYVWPGVWPPESEWVYIQPIHGRLDVRGYYHGARDRMPFPSVAAARDYAKTHRVSLYNIVTLYDERFTRVVESSYRERIGKLIEAGDTA